MKNKKDFIIYFVGVVVSFLIGLLFDNPLKATITALIILTIITSIKFKLEK